MAKVFIEESTLTDIGDAIREKEGTAELIPVEDMKARILAIQSGGGGELPEEAFSITGNSSYMFYNGGWDWFIERYGNKVSTADITSLASAFEASKVVEIPFTLNIKNCTSLDNAFYGCAKLTVCPKIRGTFSSNCKLGCFTNTSGIADIEELFEPSMLDYYSATPFTSSSTFSAPVTFMGCRSLRRLPSWWYKLKLNEGSSYPTSATHTIYSYLFYSTTALDEALNIPVWTHTKPITANMFGNAIVGCNRLKEFTFETNNGQPIVANWKSQSIPLNGAGHGLTETNSEGVGIAKDKFVKDDATYQALKDDPDWFAYKAEYSRYNHDSAVNTINSLPDTSAYLASAGGTNTIKFTGAAGSLTDGGAINTLTAEEIAVAAAKGWTVSIS